MKRRSLLETTILGHLSKALEAGYFVDYRRGIVSLLVNTLVNALSLQCVLMCYFSWVNRRTGRDNHKCY